MALYRKSRELRDKGRRVWKRGDCPNSIRPSTRKGYRGVHFAKGI